MFAASGLFCACCEKASQMFRHCRIGRVGQSQFLKADTTLAQGYFVAFDCREEAFQQHAVNIFTQQFGLDCATDQLPSFA